MPKFRVAIVCDYPEEGWPSMDLTAQMTLAYLQKDQGDEFEAVRICPRFRHRFGRLPLGTAHRVGRNIDRILNRYFDYPRALRRLQRTETFDLFHIVDHSYAQLVHELPRAQVVVTCHDLDTFRCLLQPDREPRPAWFRHLTRRTLTGLQAAAAVSCDSEATRNAILEHHLIPNDRLTTNYLGTDPEFSLEPSPGADETINRLIGPARSDQVELLHVGSNIPRKRIDVLLDVFAAIRQRLPNARLVKAGGELNPAQTAQAQELGVLDAINVIPLLKDRAALAALYRRAALVLQPSEAEGFGLPLAEAMACGTPLLVSDIAVLREVAGEAALYCKVGDVPAWTETALSLLSETNRKSPAYHARRSAGLAQAARFRWNTHVDQLAEIYHKTICSRQGSD